MDDLISRSVKLLAFMSESDAAGTLIETGVSHEDAFLAVKAAAILTAAFCAVDV